MAETLLWVLPLIPAVTALLMFTTRDRRILSAIDVGSSAILFALTLVLALMVVVMAFHLSASLGTVRQAITGNALPVGIALTLTGVLVMATRKTALTQMVGLFASENGIFFTAMSVTEGMPLIIEIGVILDVILAALVMTIMVLRVRSTVDADIADLDRLRG